MKEQNRQKQDSHHINTRSSRKCRPPACRGGKHRGSSDASSWVVGGGERGERAQPPGPAVPFRKDREMGLGPLETGATSIPAGDAQ